MSAHQIVIAGKPVVVNAQKDLEQFPNADLLELFNRLTGKTTSKFASRDKALTQTWGAICFCAEPTEFKPEPSTAKRAKAEEAEYQAQKGAPLGPALSEPNLPTETVTEAPSAPLGAPLSGTLTRPEPADDPAVKSDKKFVRKGKTMRDAETGQRVLFFRMPLGGPNNLTPKEARSGSARAVALGLLRRPEGATFEQVMEDTKWNRDQAYEGIRILNIFLGWRLDTDEDGNIRAYNTRNGN